jgi:flagellum-specific peptidoglycan hydrolase FlgJ
MWRVKMPSSAQQKEFINQIGPIIQEEARARGYHVCSPIIAQACLESNYGVSQLSAKWHNYFGMKCGSSWKGQSVNLATKEEYNSQLVNIRDNFRVYGSMEEGVKGYFDFISVKRYANLLTATTPKEYLEMIKRDGYATSSSYVNSCMAVISRHDLERYDNFETIPFGNPYTRTASVMRSGSRGESVKWVQYRLNELGYNLVIDGLYGPKTESAVRDFQTKVFVDGVVGPLTIEKLNK